LATALAKLTRLARRGECSGKTVFVLVLFR
jgi:hypothetical protein